MTVSNATAISKAFKKISVLFLKANAFVFTHLHTPIYCVKLREGSQVSSGLLRRANTVYPSRRFRLLKRKRSAISNGLGLKCC